MPLEKQSGIYSIVAKKIRSSPVEIVTYPL